MMRARQPNRCLLSKQKRTAAACERISVRAAVPADAPAIAALADELRAALSDQTGHLTPQKILHDAFGPDACISILIAQTGERIIGYAIYLDTYETAHAARGVYLADLYVAPDCRRQGAGRALVEAVTEKASDRGLRFIWWLTPPDSAQSLAFYRQLSATFTADMIAHALVLRDD